MEKQQKPTEKEKLAILKEAELHGVTATLNKYGIYPATFYYWKRKVSEAGNEGLKHGMTKERLQGLSWATDVLRISSGVNNLSDVIVEQS